MDSEEDDRVCRYTIDEIDRAFEACVEETTIAQGAREILARFACCQPEYAAKVLAAAAAAAASGGLSDRRGGRPGPGWKQQQQQQQQQHPGNSVDCWVTAGKSDRRRGRGRASRPTEPSGTGRQRPQLGNGGDVGARALLGALNKLNERNFDAILVRVCELVDDGSVEPEKAARAIISKSCDDATYARTFARLLSAVSGKSDAALAEALKLVSDLFVVERHLSDEIAQVAAAIDSPGATPEAGYDAYCAAMRSKRRLLGRSSFAFAAISTMAAELSAFAQRTQQTFPRPADVVSVLLEALGDAKAKDDATAVDLTLDVAGQLVATIGASASSSHTASLAALRSGIRDALAPLSDASPKIRFKVQDLLAPPTATPPRRSSQPASSRDGGGGGGGRRK